MNNRTVIVITGPTASGKTSLGVSLALALGTEVVSADSMQLYRGMDIGSAKPTREEMRGVPHHMIDVADPAEDYSVSRWVENAAACCDALLAGGKTPVIVGGTGLYIESLLSGRDFSAAPGDSGVREALGADAEAAIEPHGEKAHVDLKLLNTIWLQKAGVQTIDVSPDCTMCSPDRFWSHRVAGGRRGSQAAIIKLGKEAAQ